MPENSREFVVTAVRIMNQVMDNHTHCDITDVITLIVQEVDQAMCGSPVRFDRKEHDHILELFKKRDTEELMRYFIQTGEWYEFVCP